MISSARSAAASPMTLRKKAAACAAKSPTDTLRRCRNRNCACAEPFFGLAAVGTEAALLPLPLALALTGSDRVEVGLALGSGQRAAVAGTSSRNSDSCFPAPVLRAWREVRCGAVRCGVVCR